ncbi:unnamed protein product [Dovyalis caffra]|uniref:Uncharacterized protein n=1 Tax=Dovyalis caffra TaxID=77055 RepID=A0AAV1RJ92_9ROSI|nr:unnamed protein product [Dovyalis caffra]
MTKLLASLSLLLRRVCRWRRGVSAGSSAWEWVSVVVDGVRSGRHSQQWVSARPVVAGVAGGFWMRGCGKTGIRAAGGRHGAALGEFRWRWQLERSAVAGSLGLLWSAWEWVAVVVEGLWVRRVCRSWL